MPHRNSICICPSLEHIDPNLPHYHLNECPANPVNGRHCSCPGDYPNLPGNEHRVTCEMHPDHWRNDRSTPILVPDDGPKIEHTRMPELQEALEEIQALIDDISDHAREAGIKPFQLRTVHGGWVLTELYAAKCQLLAAMAIMAPPRIVITNSKD